MPPQFISRARPREVAYRPERALPHDLMAEKAVLGSILLDNTTLDAVEAILSASDFYDPRHGTVYGVFLDLRARGSKIDVVTVAHALRAIDRLNTVGGAQYLGELTDEIPTVAHVESHAEIVLGLAGVRRIVETAMTVVMESQHGVDPGAFVDRALKMMTDAAQRMQRTTLTRLEDGIVAAFERIENTLSKGQSTLGVPTGFHELDALMGGMVGGQLIIIAARPAMGKTSMVLNISTTVAKETGRPVAFFSLEMPTVELVNRALCTEARVDLLRFRTSKLSVNDVDALTHAANALHKLPVLVSDEGEATPATVRAALRGLVARGLKPALVVIDYLQLMRLTREPSPASEREKEISAITRSLKAIAKEFDVPIIALSQLNRNLETRPGKNRRPILADLRESGAIEQDADVVMFVYRDEVYHKDTEDKGIAEIILAKQRNGPTGTVRLRFVGACTLFENFAKPQDPYYVEPGRGDVDNIPDDFPDY